MNQYDSIVTFLADEKLIVIHDNITSLNVEQDLYLAWKKWVLQDNNMSYYHAFEWVPGIPDDTGYMNPIFYLVNGWHVRTWEGDHILTINGYLFTKDGSPSFVNTIGDYKINISMQTYNNMNSSLNSRLDDIASKLNELLVKGNAYDSMLNTLLDDAILHRKSILKVEDLVYQVLGLSRSNFKIINPVYKEGNVTNSTIQTFKSREDMLSGKVFKVYRMTSDTDELGRLTNFRVIETAASVAATQHQTEPITPANTNQQTSSDMYSPNHDLM